MKKERCKAVGQEFFLGVVNARYSPTKVTKHKGDIKCPECSKMLKQSVTLGRVMDFHITHLFCYIRYHKA